MNKADNFYFLKNVPKPFWEWLDNCQADKPLQGSNNEENNPTTTK